MVIVRSTIDGLDVRSILTPDLLGASALLFEFVPSQCRLAVLYTGSRHGPIIMPVPIYSLIVK